MNALVPKSILITQGELVNYTGSEIVTLELAEHFSNYGSMVHVLTNYIGEPIAKDFKNLKNVVLHTTTENIDFNLLDLVWIHHQLIPQEIVELAESSLLKTKVVFHHMSPYHPLEFPFLVRIEKELADLVLFNSHETKRAIEAQLNSIDLKGHVFSNPAPDEFRIEHAGRKYSKKLGRLLVVSNHLPSELIEAINTLKSNGVDVKIFGMTQGETYKRVRPKDLQWADAIISIGKTVQYALQGGVPVYCYDHFGGSGYLAKHNFQKNSDLNFSGRGFAKKESTVIVDELLADYSKAQIFAKQARDEHGLKYLMSKKIDETLERLNSNPKKPFIRLSAADKAAYTSLQKQLWAFHKSFHHISKAYSELAQVHSKQSVTVTRLENEIALLKKQLEDTYKSKSWRLTEPLRIVNKNIRPQK